MSDHNPYTYEPVGRTSVGEDHFIAVEDWRDTNGERTHMTLVVQSYVGDESVTMIVPDAATARRIKNLMANMERRLP